MKRKLISYEAFESIMNESLSNAEFELVECETILSKALDCEYLKLSSFGTDKVMYEDVDGTFVHANYRINENQVEFSNIEKIVIDEESEIKNSKKILNNLLEAVLEDKKDEANKLFESYINLPCNKRVFKENITDKIYITTGKGRRSKWRGGTRPGGKAAAIKAAITRRMRDKLESPTQKEMRKKLRKAARAKLGKQITKRGQTLRRVSVRRKFMPEWTSLIENVIGFVEHKENSPIISKVISEQDEQGNVTSLVVPTHYARNEAKLIAIDNNKMDTELKVLRSSAQSLHENSKFCKDIVELKRNNNLSDVKSTQESIEKLVQSYPSVLYLTQSELAEEIKYALESMSENNFDDSTCTFLAEGLLRSAYEVYSTRANKILTAAGAEIKESDDKYASFKSIVDDFYPSLDEANLLEMQMFVDLYEAIRNVHEIALKENDTETMNESESLLKDLSDIIENKSTPSLEIAENAALWLQDIVDEAWGEEAEEMYVTKTGEHPALDKMAHKGFEGDGNKFNDGDKISNGKELAMNGPGNEGADDKDNPYVPKGGVFTISGEKDEDPLGEIENNDTWPKLTNPYLPKSENPKVK